LVRVIRSSVLTHLVNTLRDVKTGRDRFRSVVADLGLILLYEALRDFPLGKRKVETWKGERSFDFLSEEIVLVPVLRAGLAMLEGSKRLVPEAPVGFLMATRDEETLEVEINCEKMPDLTERRIVILDPMLATGNTLLKVIERVRELGAERTESLHILATREGIEKVENRFPDHGIWVAVIDEGLNHQGFILPGLGDMGDRLYSYILPGLGDMGDRLYS